MTDPTRRTAFLQEMGLGPIWSRRDIAQSVSDGQDVLLAEPTMPLLAQDTIDISGRTDNAALQEGESSSVIAATPVPLVKPSMHEMDWPQLQSLVSTCRQCGLCNSRTQTVFGTGDQKARWLFVGEGPGRNEDFQGQPFVGPAGKLLDNMLGAMGLKRGENTYIANIVKCRPTDNNRRDRPPTLDEAAACMPYLEQQIALINPTVIVALGKTAALSLLKLDPATPVSRLRGTVHRYADKPLVVTYHPAYLLRNLADKGKTWSDLCLAMRSYQAAA